MSKKIISKVSDIQKKINDAKKEKTLLIGTRTVKKNIKNGKVGSIIYASNCPENLEMELAHYSKISKIEIEKSKSDSKKLGEACGKPFNVLVIGIGK
ncbi:MAG: ribosomal L7Ae/L30e/S12e/Gadd45 family protein [Candidatus Aenigmarchaeota archaeon]|nr:ribosomal L7Ae/L30e/S12e/Gadd45 family protein [Candidatus Aenigmarchaeota archaeon]